MAARDAVAPLEPGTTGARSSPPILHHGIAVTGRCLREGISARAAEAAFFCSLALFPALLTVIAVLRALRPLLGVDASQTVSADLSLLLRVVLTARGQVAATSADDVLAGGSTGGLIGVGTVVSVVVLARGLRSVRRGVDAVCDRPDPSARREWTVAVLGAVSAVVAASVTGAAFVVGPLLGHRAALGSTAATALGVVWTWIRWPIVAAAVLLAAVLLLRGPVAGVRQRWRAVLPGAVVTVLGWAGATALVPLYVTVVARVSPTLGALGGGLIVLLWVYLLALMLLVGAEVMAYNHHRRTPLAPDPEVDDGGLG